MDTHAAIMLGLKILSVGFLVLLNGFFVAAEFALVKVRDTQLHTLITKGHRRAKIARRLIRDLDAALSATQLGITIASLGLGWIGEPVFLALLGPALNWAGIENPNARHSIAFAAGFSTITFLHIVAGELAPKSLAIAKPLPQTVVPVYLGAESRIPMVAAAGRHRTGERGGPGSRRGGTAAAVHRFASTEGWLQTGA
jgi:CBS domain containing-hemolysin-like protein